MKVKFYGRLADVLGSEQQLDIGHGRTVEEVRRLVAERHPDAGEALLDRKVRACIGESIVPDSRAVEPDETVEFFPPVSGG